MAPEKQRDGQRGRERKRDRGRERERDEEREEERHRESVEGETVTVESDRPDRENSC